MRRSAVECGGGWKAERISQRKIISQDEAVAISMTNMIHVIVVADVTDIMRVRHVRQKILVSIVRIYYHKVVYVLNVHLAYVLLKIVCYIMVLKSVFQIIKMVKHRWE